MDPAPGHQQQLEQFPPVLRELIKAELAAGNEIVEIGGGFPAPPVGAYIKLAKKVTTRPRQATGTLTFFERNMPGYSGEFTDDKRFFFVLEPPNPPEPEPDMNAIRAEREARQRAADEQLYAAQADAASRARPSRRKTVEHDAVVPLNIASVSPAAPTRTTTTVERFRESMVINYERWHDGIGYDLELRKTATPEELLEIENLLVGRGVSDWRDVEALAALDTPRARDLLRQTLQTGNREHAAAVARYAPTLVSEDEKITVLVAMLEAADFHGGLTQALLQVEDFHPPAIIDALLRGVLKRSDGPAVHFAALLMYLHGKAKSSFDWDQRPYFLRFATDNPSEGQKLFRDLCAKIGIAPERYLQPTPETPSQ